MCGNNRELYDKHMIEAQKGSKNNIFFKGFAYHVKEDHNMWHYLFYISYIIHKDVTELTGIESYVKDCIDKKNIEWFPIHK
jgi:hypothetical protein